jgi:hypothetical protein
MRKPPETKDHSAPFYPDVTEFAPITVREDIIPDVVVVNPETTLFLDTLVAGIKWVFLFLPGTAAIHFLMMGLSLLFFYNDWSPEPVIGSVGGAIFSTFMVMLGVGKLSELKYLKAVGAIFAAATLAAICYSISILFIPGDFFGWFTLMTLPLTIAFGQLVKQKIDREDRTDSE